MKKYLLLLSILLSLWVGSVQAGHYNPTNIDFQILDRIEKSVSNAINKWNIDPQTFVDKVQEVLEKKDYGDRVESLLGLLIQDLNYSYQLNGAVEELAMSPEDCYDDERFDTKASICVPLDEDEQTGDNANSWNYYDEEEGYYDDEEWYYDDEEGYYDDYEDDYNYDDYVDDDYTDSYEDDGSQWDYEEGEDDWQNVPNDAVYKVTDDTIALSSGKKDESHSKIWNLFIKLIPTEYRKDLTSMAVYNDKQSDIIASVYQNEQDRNVWDLSINKANFYTQNGAFNVKENIHTLVHEYAHLLTLSKTQVDYIPSNIQSDTAIDRLASKCVTTFVSEGCLKSGAYLEQFIKKFWTKSEIQAVEEQGVDLYTKKPKSFVSDYAAADTAEDIAETFTYFVLKDKPTGTTIADQKIQFFYQFDELVALRELIRKRIDDINTAQ